MHLPEYVTTLMEALERRGFEAWAVGGCVRDAHLGIEPHDFDLCTSALPQETQAVFADHPLVLAGLKHGTVGVVTAGEVVEITTFRTEGDYSDGRHPGWVRFVPTIEEDLARRDFTINAMAYSPTRGYADPFGGLADLENNILRAVGDPVQRFREDALRILRGARFAARFGLTMEEATWDAMLSERQRLDDLARERILEEMTKLLCLTDARMLLKLQPIIARVIPELESAMGFDQRSPHHAFDVFTHIAYVTERVSPTPVMRWAALLHDVGKPASFTTDENGRGHFYGHAGVGAGMADQILRRLKAPNALREEVVWLIDHHMSKYPAEVKNARRCLSRHGLGRMERLIQLQMADFGCKGVLPQGEEDLQLERLRTLLRRLAEEEGELSLKNLAVNGRDLMAFGYPAGPGLGKALNRLLQMVIAGELPNDRDALLEKAKEWM